MALFSGIPFWAYWLLIGVALLFIYFWLFDDTTKSAVRVFLSKFGIYIFIFLMWLFMRQYLGNFVEGDWFDEQANTYALIMLLSVFMARNYLGVLRYKSIQAISDNRSGSCTRYQAVGDYYVLNVGTTDADGIAWPSGHESWIIPKRHFKKINGKVNSPSQIMCETFLMKCDLTEVPVKCQDFIETTFGYNKDEIYYGEFSLSEVNSTGKATYEGKETVIKDIINDLTIKLKDNQRMLNETRAMLKGKTSAIKGFVSDTSAIQKKARGESLIVERQGGGE